MAFKERVTRAGVLPGGAKRGCRERPGQLLPLPKALGRGNAVTPAFRVEGLLVTWAEFITNVDVYLLGSQKNLPLATGNENGTSGGCVI